MMNSTLYRKRGRILLGAMMACSATVLITAQSAGGVATEEVHERWELRERAIRSSNLKLDWIERQIRTTAPVSDGARTEKVLRGVIPPQSDQTVQFDTSVFASHGRIRYVRKGPAFDGRIGKMGRSTLTVVWDGKTGRELQAFDDERPPVGEIAKSTAEISD
jgi:hypothetical protein